MGVKQSVVYSVRSLEEAVEKAFADFAWKEYEKQGNKKSALKREDHKILVPPSLYKIQIKDIPNPKDQHRLKTLTALTIPTDRIQKIYVNEVTGDSETEKWFTVLVKQDSVQDIIHNHIKHPKSVKCEYVSVPDGDVVRITVSGPLVIPMELKDHTDRDTKASETQAASGIVEKTE